MALRPCLLQGAPSGPWAGLSARAFCKARPRALGQGSPRELRVRSARALHELRVSSARAPVLRIRSAERYTSSS
eukprot:5308638-Alexandrium_andersonii.AAC.1